MALKHTLREVGAQLAGSVPLLLFNVAQFALNLASMSWVGQLGALELAGASLAISFSNVTGLSLVIGVSFALETLVSQAQGAKRYSECGLALQRSLITSALIMFFVSLFWMLGSRIFLAMGQPRSVSEVAGTYLLWLTPAVWFQACSNSVQRYLQGMGQFTPLLVIAPPLFGLQVVLLELFVKHGNLGYRGGAMASNVTSFVGAVGLMTYVCVSEARRKDAADRRWTGWSRDALDPKAFLSFLRTAVFSTAMIVIEWWAFECTILMSGWLPKSEGGETTAASAICFSTVAALFTAVLGLSSTSSSRVGNALGEGDGALARFRAKVTLGMTLAYQGVVFPLLVTHGISWARLFASSDDSGVLEHVGRILPVVAMATLGDAFQGVLSGIIRGCGRQDHGSAINIVAYYVIGVPTGAGLAFGGPHLGILGLWIGIAIATNIQALSLCALVARTDWHAEALRACQDASAAKAGAPCVELSPDPSRADDDEEAGGVDEESRGLLASPRQ